MLEVAGSDVKSFPLDHHGLIAAVCKDLKIAERIDALLPIHEQRVVSPGRAVVAMILNGLGFTNRRLYLTPQFFESKPVARLLDAPIKAEDLNDYALGHALDDLSAFGVSRLFGHVAFGIALEHRLLGNLAHLDTTSLSVSGEYERPGAVETEPATIRLTHGFSKDNRPDLKQAVMSLVMSGPSQIPIWMEALDGNSSDKTSFHETIRKVRAFQNQLHLESDFKWVADSALYSTDGLLARNDYLWTTRVPETIGEARERLSQDDAAISWEEGGGGYKYSETLSVHGNVPQRWLLVHSEKAYAREKKTLERKLAKEASQLKKDIARLGSQVFGCEADAARELAKLAKAYPLYLVHGHAVPVRKYARKGKPAAGDEPIVVGFTLDLVLERNEEAVGALLNRKGRFLLATNDMDKEAYPASRMLSEYKEQQEVERGFRFLKDPWFMVDSVFLKAPRRIEALMMVMTLCLLVYNLAQYRIRDRLKATGATLPNQLDKEVRNPTLRWIFQIMEGLGIVRFAAASGEGCQIREMVTNMTPLRRKIIQLLGPTACEMHGLIPENAD
ncbi:MAG TPA: IS1634 family transposase [Fibrobacteria bacterium]|nr:IS1634 family transposase [Fibrobacteria bacterium]